MKNCTFCGLPVLKSDMLKHTQLHMEHWEGVENEHIEEPFDENKMKEEIVVLEEKVDKIERVLEKTDDVLGRHEDDYFFLSKKCLSLECEQYSTKYIFKQVPVSLTGNETKESFAKTEEIVNEILTIAGLNGDYVDNCFRMYKKGRTNQRNANTDPQNNFPHIFVQG